MNGANTYVYTDAAKVLEEGEYAITLKKPYETSVGGYNCLKFPFSVDGVDEDVVPKEFTLFDVQDLGNKEQVATFNRMASRISDCFELHGNFISENYALWEGKKGCVQIGKDKNGYTVVKKFLPKM